MLFVWKIFGETELFSVKGALNREQTFCTINDKEALQCIKQASSLFKKRREGDANENIERALKTKLATEYQ